MNNNSLLQGTVWYWRQGLKEVPMHSCRERGDMVPTKELYLPISDEEKAKKILFELKQNGILAYTKMTHSSYDVVPKGSLILYASQLQEEKIQSEEENIKKLKTYILSNGGKIEEGNKRVSSMKRFILSLFNGGRK